MSLPSLHFHWETALSVLISTLVTKLVTGPVRDGPSHHVHLSNDPAVTLRCTAVARLLFQFSSLLPHISFGHNQVLVFTVALSVRVTHHNSESGDL